MLRLIDLMKSHASVRFINKLLTPPPHSCHLLCQRSLGKPIELLWENLGFKLVEELGSDLAI